jgi:polyferredoxin
MRLPVLAVALVMIVHGLAGPRLAPKNLATVLTWLHFRGLLMLGLLLAGNLFCMACPFILVRDLARRLIPPTRKWPGRWRNKWPAVVLTVLLLFAYELFDLWGEPVWTAALILLYFGGAVVMGVLFERAPFCSHFCPLGQFSLVLSLVSPLEVKVRDPQTCVTCRTKDCLKGCGDQQGCELGLLQQKKVGNMNCHWRLDCLRACPHDNVGILPRLPGSELWVDPVRSGIGRLSRRTDIAFLIRAAQRFWYDQPGLCPGGLAGRPAVHPL